MKICEDDKCTSCLACYSVCPVNAIAIVTNQKGFYRPQIDENKCIKCNKCKIVCLSNSKLLNEKFEQKVFACWSNNNEVRRDSTSGGVFTHMAEFVLNNNGTVFGAAFNKNNEVVHCCIDNQKDLLRLRGSKYVQSYIGDAFKEVKLKLNKGIKVLFSGTPCQVFGLKKYLGKSYDNLYTIDLVCHGVPSPKIFKGYLKNLEIKYKSKAKKILFRNKVPGWKVYGMKIEFENGSIYMKDTFNDNYLLGFLQNYFLNDACYKCKFANTNRQSDITIADFWGYKEESLKMVDDDKGISLLIINSSTGLELYNNIKSELISAEKTLSEAVNGNPCLSYSFPKNEKYDEFWIDYKQNNIDELSQKYFVPKDNKSAKEIRAVLVSLLSPRQRYIIRKIIKYFKSIN